MTTDGGQEKNRKACLFCRVPPALKNGLKLIADKKSLSINELVNQTLQELVETDQSNAIKYPY